MTIAVPPGTYPQSERARKAEALNQACIATRRAIRLAHTPHEARHQAAASLGIALWYSQAVSLLAAARS